MFIHSSIYYNISIIIIIINFILIVLNYFIIIMRTFLWRGFVQFVLIEINLRTTTFLLQNLLLLIINFLHDFWSLIHLISIRVNLILIILLINKLVIRILHLIFYNLVLTWLFRFFTLLFSIYRLLRWFDINLPFLIIIAYIEWSKLCFRILFQFLLAFLLLSLHTINLWLII